MATFDGTVGDDTINGSKTADIINGGLGNDTLIGNGGNDTIDGGEGNDTLIGGKGVDILTGGLGDDSFIQGIGDGFDIFSGGDGYDRIIASAAAVVLSIGGMNGIEEISSGGFANVNILGTSGNDLLDFSAITLTGIDTIFGANGDDTIIGTVNSDRVNGGTGDDTLNTGDGDDKIFVSNAGGADSIDGGTGYDIVEATAHNILIRFASLAGVEEISGGAYFGVKIDGGAGDDVYDFTNVLLTNISSIRGNGGNDTLIGSNGDDTIVGGSGNDLINGGAGNDFLEGSGGNDILNGGSGNDTLNIGAGDDTYIGGIDYNRLVATHDNTVLRMNLNGTSIQQIQEISSDGWSNFVIAGFADQDNLIDLRRFRIFEDEIAEINAGSGNDTVFGSRWYDIINGGNGDDVIDSGLGDDEVYGQGGNDTLNGGGGFDTIDGGAGDDIINGGNQDDTLRGGKGNDTFVVMKNAGIDSYVGGEDYDTVAVGQAGVAAINIFSFESIEEITAGGFAPVAIRGTFGDDNFDFTTILLSGIKSIEGGNGNDSITGSSGDDLLDGGAGTDTLIGGQGNDVLIGGKLVDTLTGGDGADIFQGKAADLAGDIITDFSLGDSISVFNTDPAKLTVSYNAGLLRIDPDGAGLMKAFSINLAGDFSTASFHTLGDGLGNTLVQLIG